MKANHELIPGVIWIDWVVFGSLLFASGAGYLNDNIAMELIQDVGHFYVAPCEKPRSTFLPRCMAAMPHVTVVTYRNSAETVCNLLLVKLYKSSACHAAMKIKLLANCFG